MTKWNVLLIALGVTLLTSCSDVSKDEGKLNKYRLPVPSNHGGMSFETVIIDDLQDPFIMSGASANVIVSEDYSYSEGPVGSPAKPNFIRAGSVLVPTDTKSIAAVASYYHFNRIKKLDELLGIKDRLTWPRKVGILTNPLFMTDNAFYQPFNDTINIVPYTEELKPLYINGAVLAHEHFHAHYNTLVKWTVLIQRSKMNGKLSGQLEGDYIEICEGDKFYNLIAKSVGSPSFPETEATVSLKKSENSLSFSQEVFDKLVSFGVEEEKLKSYPYLDQENLSKLTHQVNYIIGRAWDEGNADTYAYLYDKNPNFLTDSIKSAHYRKIDGSYKGTYKSASNIVMDVKVLNDFRCNPGSRKNVEALKNLGIPTENAYSYLMASDYAKFLKKLSESEVLSKKYGDKAQENLVKSLANILPEINSYMANTYLKEFLSPLKPIELLVNKLGIQNEPEVCDLLEEFYGENPMCSADTKKVEATELTGDKNEA